MMRGSPHAPYSGSSQGWGVQQPYSGAASTSGHSATNGSGSYSQASGFSGFSADAAVGSHHHHRTPYGHGIPTRAPEAPVSRLVADLERVIQLMKVDPALCEVASLHYVPPQASGRSASLTELIHHASDPARGRLDPATTIPAIFRTMDRALDALDRAHHRLMESRGMASTRSLSDSRAANGSNSGGSRSAAAGAADNGSVTSFASADRSFTPFDVAQGSNRMGDQHQQPIFQRPRRGSEANSHSSYTSASSMGQFPPPGTHFGQGPLSHHSGTTTTTTPSNPGVPSPAPSAVGGSHSGPMGGSQTGGSGSQSGTGRVPQQPRGWAGPSSGGHNSHSRELKHLVKEITVLTKQHRLSEAFDAVNRLRAQSIHPNTIVYNALMAGCQRCSDFSATKRLFAEMQTCGISPDVFTYNILIEAYAKSDRMDKVYPLLSQMSHAGIHPNVVTFNKLIDAFSRQRRFPLVNSALELMEQYGVQRNVYTYNILLAAYARIRNIDKMDATFRDMQSAGITADSVTFSTLVDFFSKVKRFDRVGELLDQMDTLKLSPNVVLFTTLVNGYGNDGREADVSRVATRMVAAGVSANETFCRTLASVCKKLAVPSTIMSLLTTLHSGNVISRQQLDKSFSEYAGKVRAAAAAAKKGA